MAKEPKEPNVAGARAADQQPVDAGTAASVGTAASGTGSDRAPNPPPAEGSGKRFTLSEPDDGTKVRNPSKEKGQTARMTAEFLPPAPEPLGRVMDRPAEVEPALGHLPQVTIPFGREPQTIDPATGNVVPVSPEMLRTGSDEPTSVEKQRRETALKG